VFFLAKQGLLRRIMRPLLWRPGPAALVPSERFATSERT
jgi:hypothetical protein